MNPGRRQTVNPGISIFAFALAVCLFPSVKAQKSNTAPASPDGPPAISDENFATVAQQIRELKDPSFRTYMRARLIGLIKPADSAERRQAALSVANEALSDLCANESEVWRAAPSWLHDQVIAAVKNFDNAEAASLAGNCKLKTDERGSDAARKFSDFSDAIRMMSDPAKAGSAGEKARAAILTGEISAASLMGQFLQMQHANTPGMAPLLSATLTVEDQKPGFLSQQILPFISTVFMADSVPADIRSRFIAAVVARTRLSPEELANPVNRSMVYSALLAIAEPAKTLAPDLYPEVASRLNSVAPGATARRAELQAIEDRIKTSSDQLEQMQTEAGRTSDSNFRGLLLNRAARLAVSQGKLRQAVDLACADYGDAPANSVYLDAFLASVISEAVKKEQPDAIVYAVSKTAKPLNKANGLIALAKYYAGAKEPEKVTAALHDAAKALPEAESSNEKLRAAISLSRGFIEYDRVEAFAEFRQIVDTLNKLPLPEKQKEKTIYVPFPTVDELMKTFRALAAQDEPGAFALAQDIKSTELRLAAVCGVYSHTLK
ncbi:MAG TPA: hypothetical protein VE961_14715 [Pyrinomonadaceae bacterium]|nr:hypothetical protein [Pyrinomonadaceae bacterium]